MPMPDIRRFINELKDEVYKKASTDPKQSAKELNESCSIMASVMQDLDFPRREQAKILLSLIEDHLAMFKAKSLEEMLGQQKETNDALAAALNMSAERKAEKK